MNKILIIIFLTCLNLLIQGQTIDYKYDVSGNMINKIISLKHNKTKDINDSVFLENTQYFLENIESYSESISGHKINIYPNPVKESLNIDFSFNQSNTNIQIHLYNRSGQSLQIIQGNEKGNQGKYVLNMSTYSKGLYILIININNQKTEWKVIKE